MRFLHQLLLLTHMSSPTASTDGDSQKKVDMSSDAVHAYYRKLQGHRKDLPSYASSGGVKSSDAAAVARLATKKENTSRIVVPSGRTTAASRASVLANNTTLELPRATTQGDVSAKAATVARDYKVESTVPEGKSDVGAKAAVSALGTSGEEYARRYLGEGYQWTERSNSLRSARGGRTGSITSAKGLDLSRLQAAAQQRANESVASLQERNGYKLPYGNSEHDRSFDVKQAVSVYQIAEQRVRDSMAKVEKDNADRSIYGTHEARAKAYEIANAASQKRNINFGKRNLGAGLFMNDDEIMSIARRHVEPDLEQIAKLVEDRHERDRIAAEEAEALRQAKEEERSRQRAAKEEQQQERAKQKQAEREKRNAEKESERRRREDEKARKDEEQRIARERKRINDLELQAKEAEEYAAAVKEGKVASVQKSRTLFRSSFKAPETTESANDLSLIHI